MINTPDLQACQKLKGLGFPQSSENNYYEISKENATGTNIVVRSIDWAHLFMEQHRISVTNTKVLCAAPSLEEIWKELPTYIFRCEVIELRMNAYIKQIGYFGNHSTEKKIIGYDNIAQAAAELWIWTKERHNY